mgnify:CR=1 FL=1
MEKILTNRYVKIGAIVIAIIGIYLFFTTIVTIEKGEMTTKSDIKNRLLPAYLMLLFIFVPFISVKNKDVDEPLQSNQ